MRWGPFTLKPAPPSIHPLEFLHRGVALKIQQYGSESAEVSTNGGFVMVHVPVQLVGEAPKGGTTLRYSIGSFVGRETKLLARTGTQANLTFRIPKELLRARQHLKLEVLAGDDEGVQSVLWTKRYEASWTGSTPHVEPIVDLIGEEPEPEH